MNNRCDLQNNMVEVFSYRYLYINETVQQDFQPIVFVLNQTRLGSTDLDHRVNRISILAEISPSYSIFFEISPRVS